MIAIAPSHRVAASVKAISSSIVGKLYPKTRGFRLQLLVFVRE
jgi:hypothetical protein